MPISTNTATDFASATGYTIFEAAGGDVTFSGGTAFLSGTATKEAAVQTPAVNASAFVAVQQAVPTVTEAVGYAHTFLVAFEDPTDPDLRLLWRTHYPGGGWLAVADGSSSRAELLAALNSYGLGRYDLANVFEWPAVDAGLRISFLVGMHRTVSSAAGSIDLISIRYGSEVKTVNATETSIGTLAFQPQDFAPTLRQDFDEIAFAGGYRQFIELDTLTRREASLTWGVLTDTDADTLVAFLESARATHFEWQPLNDPTTRKWKTKGTILKTQAGVKDRYNVSATIAEYFQ